MTSENEKTADLEETAADPASVAEAGAASEEESNVADAQASLDGVALSAESRSSDDSEGGPDSAGNSESFEASTRPDAPVPPKGAASAEDSASSQSSASNNASAAVNSGDSLVDRIGAYLRKIWPQLRRLLLLEIKLCLAVLRNMIAMPVAFIAMMLDLLQDKEGKTENFDKVIDIGQSTEDKINLFAKEEETLEDESSVDAILKRAEDKLRDL